MIVHLKPVWNLIIPVLIWLAVVSVVLSIPVQEANPANVSNREPKTMDMGNMMNKVQQVIQSGMNFPPKPPPLSALRELFKVQGAKVTWVPLGSLIFNHDGKIMGG